MTYEEQRAQRTGSMRTSRSAGTSSAAGTSRSTRSSRTARATSRTPGTYSSRLTSTGASRPSLSGASGDAGTATKERRPISIVKIIVLVALLALVIVVARVCSAAAPVTVTVNGAQVTIHGAKTLQVAARESGLPINPGDLISLRGDVIQKNAGYVLTATVNGEPTVDPELRLHNGDVIEISDGQDMVEEYDEVLQPVPYSTTIAGIGAIHVFTSEGSDGELSIRTGRLSGDVVEKQTTAPENAVFQRYNVSVGNDKVIALTFDDGPSDEYTAQILDILAQNDVQATFFVIGTNVERPGGADLLRRMQADGHQICSHSYDHARASGNHDMTELTPDQQVDEMLRGMQVIADALAVVDAEGEGEDGTEGAEGGSGNAAVSGSAAAPSGASGTAAASGAAGGAASVSSSASATASTSAASPVVQGSASSGNAAGTDGTSDADGIDTDADAMPDINTQSVKPIDPTRIVRFPGGTSDEDMLTVLAPYVDAEIGWTIDTGDWIEPGAAAIEDVLLSVRPGDIVLLHDGGGDRSGTVEALRVAIPKLKAQGFTFVTVSQMMEYPQGSVR